MASRAAAFTADAALNGFGLRGLEGIFLISSQSRIPDDYNGLLFHDESLAALQPGCSLCLSSGKPHGGPQ
jgi:hypothetical protein